MRIAIDIDGILTTDIEGHDYKNRKPNLKNINQTNALYHDGHTIILYTARFWRDYFVTKQWLHDHHVYYHKLIMRKVQYDVLIDDKAVNSFNDIK